MLSDDHLGTEGTCVALLTRATPTQSNLTLAFITACPNFPLHCLPKLPPKQIASSEPASSGATEQKVDATQATAAAANDTKVDAKGNLPPPAGVKDGNNKPQNLSKEEQLATKLFKGTIKMGVGLEGVTNLGRNTKEIVDQSKKVSQMLPMVKTLTTELLGAAPKKSNELNKAVEESTNAGEAIT
ncbi:hypothetical protein PtA15_1A575 [Puccinia triticina]|uniref:Uncharacterized protein n=1 Tax=Puccinia triticina TaxID=208348 RepID=A0ABY7C7T7_9BASI|nr:uncharacterized protein PtA15_1A575 [Puccinia triticina]WAQ81235.1 hypothetical protein PtA15_1A575 [Puccinia triticina]